MKKVHGNIVFISNIFVPLCEYNNINTYHDEKNIDYSACHGVG